MVNDRVVAQLMFSSEGFVERWHKVICAFDTENAKVRLGMDGKTVEGDLDEDQLAVIDEEWFFPKESYAVDELIFFDRALLWDEITSLSGRVRMMPSFRASTRTQWGEQLRELIQMAGDRDAMINLSVRQTFNTFDNNRDGVFNPDDAYWNADNSGDTPFDEVFGFMSGELVRKICRARYG